MLSLIDLHKRYGDVVALDGAGFDVEPGRIVGFLGPNGAGKTTAMRCVFGLVTPDDGEVRWKGKVVGHAERLRFGYMPEERGLYPKMGIEEQLVYFARLSGLSAAESARAAAGWLERLGIADRSRAKLEDLSHGNQQRIQLAAALVHDPEVAVLDEPFSGLDPIGMEALTDVLREMAARGVAIVFSSHQLDLVEDVCEDVVIINEGRVVLAGTVAELRARSRRRHLEVVVDGAPWAPPIEGIELVGSNRGGSRYLVTKDTPLDVILAKAQADGEITRFAFEPPRLSDLFREAVGQ